MARVSDWRRAKAALFAAERSRFSCSSLRSSGAGVGEGIGLGGAVGYAEVGVEERGGGSIKIFYLPAVGEHVLV